MATFGTFADLTPTQVELVQRRQASGGDPLTSLIQGLTQGVQLQQLPAQIQQEALTAQLKTALAQQQLQDLQNPEAALARRVREAIAIKNATSASKRNGFFDPTSGRWIEEVNGQMVARRIPFEETLGITPSVPVSIPDVSGIGLNVDPSLSYNVIPSIAPTATELPEILLPSAPTALGGTLEQRAKTAEELRKQERDFRLDLQKRDQEFREEQNKLQREYLKGKGSTTGGRGLTANQQTSLRLRGGRSLVNINDYTNPETGQVDWDTYATKIGEAEGNKLHSNNLIKDARASTKTTLDEKNLQLYGNRMNQANEDFNTLTQVGFDPTSIGSEGLIGGWLPNLLKTDQRQQFEQAERNFINASLRRESGAVITEEEFANARQQYFPQPGDGQPVLDQKAANRKLVIDEFIRLGGQPVAPQPAPTGGQTPRRNFRIIQSR